MCGCVCTCLVCLFVCFVCKTSKHETDLLFWFAFVCFGGFLLCFVRVDLFVLV